VIHRSKIRSWKGSSDWGGGKEEKLKCAHSYLRTSNDTATQNVLLKYRIKEGSIASLVGVRSQEKEGRTRQAKVSEKWREHIKTIKGGGGGETWGKWAGGNVNRNEV